MPDRKVLPERPATPVSTGERSFPGNDGKQKTVYHVIFKITDDGKERQVKADTWSAECRKVAEENIGKPLLVTVADTGREYQGSPVLDIEKLKTADGSAELYSGGQTKRGGQRGSYSQRPDWSYEDAAEREGTRRSIEAQVAEKISAEYFTALVQFGQDESLLTTKGALEFSKTMSDAIRDRMRKAAAVRSQSAAKSGSGVTERSGSDPGSRTRELEPSLRGGQEPHGSPPFASGEQGEGFPNPEPDSAPNAEAVSELIGARNAAIDVFKTPKSVEKAWAISHGGELVKFNELTAEQLADLAANPPESSAPSDTEPAGMASGGGWS
jgi:hypothetical protein